MTETTIGPDDCDGTFELFASDTRDLPVKLTLEERAERGQELAQLHARIEDLTEERRQAAADAKAVIDDLKRQAAKLGESVATGQEPRPVKVEKWGNHGSNLVRYVRTDTGEIVEERAMEADERQGSLFADTDDDDEDDGWGDDDGLADGEVDPVLPPEPGDNDEADEHDDKVVRLRRGARERRNGGEWTEPSTDTDEAGTQGE